MLRVFTLVELLAVIVILAIILAIAIPGIGNIINTAKRGALESDAKMLLKALDFQQMQTMIGATPAVTIAEDTTLYATTGCSSPCGAANITALGSVADNYTIVRIINVSPLSICIETSSSSKFGAHSIRATTSTITDIEAGTCSSLTN